MTHRLWMIVTFVLLIAAAPDTAQVCAQENPPHPRMITVSAAGEVAVPPDSVVLTLVATGRDKDLALAKSLHDRRVRKLSTLALKAGVEQKNIQTDNVEMSPEFTDEKVPKFLQYRVSQTITLTLEDLSKYEALMTAILEAGVERVNGTEFTVREPKKYKDEARVKALRAAYEKAAMMAKELGQTIGKPWEITEDIYALQTPANSFVAYDRGREKSEGLTFAPGQTAIRAAVRVSFLLE